MQRDLCLQTRRLKLRPLSQADGPRLLAIGGTPEIARMMRSIELPWTNAKVRDWINASAWQGTAPFRLGISLRDGQLIGSVGYGGEDIAFFLGRDYWGKGYATEALDCFITWLFLSFDIEDIEAEHLDDNPASGAVLLKLGFSMAGQRTCRSLARVEADPSTLYRLNRTTFEGRHEIS